MGRPTDAPCGSFCTDVLPLNATIISEKLSRANYTCHFIGKGHLGYQTMDHLPLNRGFHTHVGFLAGSEDYRYGGGSVRPCAARRSCSRPFVHNGSLATLRGRQSRRRTNGTDGHGMLYRMPCGTE